MDQNTSARRADWEARYRRQHLPWDRGEASPALSHWLDTRMPYPLRILVPGCGRGYEVVALAKRGFDVTAIDIAPSAIRWLNRKLATVRLKATVLDADVTHWRPEAPFDAVYEQTCLCALAPETWPAYVDNLWHTLKPGGRLFAIFMQTDNTDGPPWHCDLAAMRRLFDAQHWIWPKDQPLRIDHPAGFHELGLVLVRRGPTNHGDGAD